VGRHSKGRGGRGETARSSVYGPHGHRRKRGRAPPLRARGLSHRTAAVVQTPVTTRVWRRTAWIVAGVVLVAVALWFARAYSADDLDLRHRGLHCVRRSADRRAFGTAHAQTRGRRDRLFGLLAFIAIFLVIVVPLAISQTQLLAANIPAYAGTAQGWLAEAQSSLQRHFPTLKLPAYGVNTGRIGATQTSSLSPAQSLRSAPSQ